MEVHKTSPILQSANTKTLEKLQKKKKKHFLFRFEFLMGLLTAHCRTKQNLMTLWIWMSRRMQIQQMG